MGSPESVLGVMVFDGLGIRVDPVLEYSRPYGLAELGWHARNVPETTRSGQIVATNPETVHLA
jgi:hypothetical protein